LLKLEAQRLLSKFLLRSLARLLCWCVIKSLSCDPQVQLIAAAMGDNLFYVSRANIFSIYPNILKKIVAIDDAAYNPEKNLIVLPSDFEWQLKCYFRLLEQQKKLNSLDNKS
jgi:hypothetical protein